MPIRFRCTHCQGLMAISTRKAGSMVECATCGEQTLVPLIDEFGEPTPDSIRPVVPAATTSSQSAGVANTSSKPVGEIASEQFVGSPQVTDESALPETVIAPKVAFLEPEVDAEPFIPADIGDESDGALIIRRRRSGDDEMDLTPMVDVTFQLLIFFMVSASFSLQKTIEVPIPDPDQKGATQQVQTMEDLQGTSILVRIEADNTILIDEEPLADRGGLADVLRDKMRREQKTELLITAHPQSQHRLSIAVIDAANEIGVQKIRMASQKKMD